MKKNILLALVGLMCFQVGLVNANLTDEETDFKIALLENNVEEVKKLIGSGKIDVNKVMEPTFDKPLKIALLQGTPEIVQLLIDGGADINSEFPLPGDYSSRVDYSYSGTPLHYATRKKRPEFIRILIEAGADIKAPAKFMSKGKFIKPGEKPNQTPLEIATYEFVSGTEGAGDVLKVFYTTVSPKDIQHIIPTIGVLTKRRTAIGKDVGGNVLAQQLKPAIVNEKLALAKKALPNVPEEQLRKEIIESLNRVIARS